VALFGIVATTTSKTSFALTLHRITTNVWMKHFLIFVIVTINVSMNLVWIFGFAKCTPLKRVWDKDVPGTCWDGKKLLKFQLFAACKTRCRPSSIVDGLTASSRRLLGNSRFCARTAAMADYLRNVDAATREDWSGGCDELGCNVSKRLLFCSAL
jgi:hypothetical protein